MSHATTRGTPRLRHKPLVLCLATALAGFAIDAMPPALARPDGDAVTLVSNCDDSGPGSLRDALATATSGDDIAFTSSIGCNLIALTSGALIVSDDPNGQPITALSITGPGIGKFTIDAGELDRVFVHAAGADATLTLRDITLTRGVTDGSGGCILSEGSVVLEGVDVNLCRAGVVSGDAARGIEPVYGGAIAAGRSVTLTHSTILGNRVYGNQAYAYGGGVFALSTISGVDAEIRGNLAFSQGAAYGGGLAAGDRAGHVQGTVALTSSLVTTNTADSRCGFCGARGGGIWTYGNTTLSGGEVSANLAKNPYGYGTGGALYFNARSTAPEVTATVVGTNFYLNNADKGGGIAAGGDLDVSGATLGGNVAYADGGAIWLFGGNLTLGGSTVRENNAFYGGGGVFVFGYGDATITNSTISGNGADSGGGIGDTYGTLHVANSTIANNTALGRGGGIHFRYPYYLVDVRSTIVAGNFGGNAIDTPEDIWPPGLVVTGSNDLIVAAEGVELPADTLRDDPLLQQLELNGGATATMALAEGSPAIDGGSNPHNLDTDQRGPGFVRVYGGTADIGAYEVQPLATDTIFSNGFDP